MRVSTLLSCLTALGLIWSLQGGASRPAIAQGAAETCKSEDVAAIVDQTGARLRQHNSESQPRLRARLRELAQKRGWAEADLQTKGLALLQDEQTQAMDDQAAQLLTRLDQLGDDSKTQGPVCRRLEDARIASAQLIEVTTARSTHVLARLETALSSNPASQPAAPSLPQAAPPPPKAEVRPARSPAPLASADAARPKAPPAAAPTPPPSAWGAETVREVEPNPAAMAELPRPADPGDLGFSPDEINAAGRGFFGSISAGLAGVIDFAFTQYGRPTGYVLGNEGGGAFLAGLRYGEGHLVTKLAGEHKVYWQGPSVGYDFGLAGSQVMFLVYSVTNPEQLYTRFAGVDGSAYLVGGVGITFLKKGPIVLAPIRTGLGLRIGANIGYLKFTPSPSLNPF